MTFPRLLLGSWRIQGASWTMEITPEKWCCSLATVTSYLAVDKQQSHKQIWNVKCFLEKWPTPHSYVTQQPGPSCELLAPSISKGRPCLRWGRQLGRMCRHMAHIFLLTRSFPLAPAAAAFFGGPCMCTVTQTVSILNSGHLQMGQCDITSLESDFYWPDNPCAPKIGPEVKELSTKCSHSNFLQGKEEGIQDCYHWSLDVGWSRIALTQLTHSLCSYQVRLQLPLLFTSSILKGFHSSLRLSPQTALGSLSACSYAYSDGPTLLPLSTSALLPLFCQKQYSNATILGFLNLT